MKYIALLFMLTSCSMAERLRVPTQARHKLICIEFMMQKGLTYDEAIEVCKFTMKKDKDNDKVDTTANDLELPQY